ncbi:uncharacterized protein LOC126272355 [Schistocerca gregaria]|uniref:uncharacterized protein LOC126272355 n=1 Tax=Schistocerca gregaria TaxID=7010 RepID=UPI00211DC6CB|nr:uncharacterized protein LOC126272355 [Schistocerca gregaria]
MLSGGGSGGGGSGGGGGGVLSVGGAFGWPLPELRDDVTLPSRDRRLHKDDAEGQQAAVAPAAAAAASPPCSSAPRSEQPPPRPGAGSGREQRLRRAVDRLWRQTSRLRADIRRLHCDLKTEEQRVAGLLEEARRVRGELLDARFLDDLLLLLDGRLDCMPLRHWPFAVANAARSVAGDANLVI